MAAFYSILKVAPVTSRIVTSSAFGYKNRKYARLQKRYYRSDKVAYELQLERGTGSGPGGSMPLQEFEPVFKV